jgi:VCBS repeat-containing protein
VQSSGGAQTGSYGPNASAQNSGDDTELAPPAVPDGSTSTDTSTTDTTPTDTPAPSEQPSTSEQPVLQDDPTSHGDTPLPPATAAADSGSVNDSVEVDVLDDSASNGTTTGSGESIEFRLFTASDAEDGNSQLLAASGLQDNSALTLTQNTSTTAVDDPVQAFMAIPATVVNIAAGFVTALLSPFLAPGPAAPAQPPLVLFAVLDWLRRETQRIFFNSSPNAVANSYTTAEDIGVTGNVLTNDTDADDDDLTATLVTGPAHGDVTLNADGSFTYTPDANYNGTDTFTYRVSDEGAGWHLHGLSGLFGGGHTDTATVTVNVTAVNDAPVAVDDTATTAEGTQASGNVLTNDSDVDSSSLGAALGTAPANGTAVVNPNGTFTYTPNANFDGTDSFTYTVSDGTASDTGKVTVTVSPVQDPPDAVNDTATVAEDSGATVIDVLDNDIDVDGDDLTIQSVTQPAKGQVVINDNGTVSYTPNAGVTGTDTFTYTITDGTDEDSATVTVTVSAVNHAPVAADDELTTTEDTPLDFSPEYLLDNDSDADGDGLVTFVQSPSSGQLTIHDNGTFTYTPNANFHGTDSFSYVAHDGTTSSNIATVTVTVGSVNDAPVAQPDAVFGPEDFPEFSDNVLLNDSDADGDPLTAQLVSGPGNAAAFNLNADGTFTYTPNENFVGEDTFTYRASDGITSSAVTTVHIHVGPSNDDVVAVNDTNTTATNTSVNGNVLTNDIAQNPDGPDESLAVTTTGTITTTGGGSVNMASNGTYTYTPAADFDGVDTFSYTVTDGLTSATGQVSITVTDVVENTPPVATDDAYSTAVDVPLIIDVADLLADDIDVDGDALVIISATQANRGTLTYDPATNQLTYTPDDGFEGYDTFTYTVSDGIAESTATVSITVGQPDPTNTAPVPGFDSLGTPADTAITFSENDLLANDFDAQGDTLTLTIDQQPANGELVDNGDGTWTYTPHTGTTGPDTFSYTLNDSQADSPYSAVVTINVGGPANTAPQTEADTLTTTTNNPLDFTAEDLLGNDTDAEDDPLNIYIISQPANGTIESNGAGTFTYAPNAGYTGEDTFYYTAYDGTSDSTPTAVTITIDQTPL